MECQTIVGPVPLRSLWHTFAQQNRRRGQARSSSAGERQQVTEARAD